MKPSQIEFWALKIIDQISSGKPNEDTRVELKSDWIDPQKAARQIAGHANASQGESILWLIGVDEDNGVIGVLREELANWLPSVQSQFDGVAPPAMDLNISIDGKVVVALYFETDRAPFVVKNPLFGSDKGVVISHEVPWREGAKTRSAKRTDLLRLLVPIVNLPDIEILNGELQTSIRDNEYFWYLNLESYITPPIGFPCVLPFHRCQISLDVVNTLPLIEMSRIRLIPPYKFGSRLGYNSQPDSITIAHTQREAIVEGPGQLNIHGEANIECNIANLTNSTVNIKIILRPTNTDKSLTLTGTMEWRIPEAREAGAWTIKRKN